MTKEATVTKLLPNGMAEIAVMRESACGGNCHSCGGTCASKNIMKVSAKNGISAQVGDQVIVYSSTSGILTAAAIVYLIPLVLFFALYGITAALKLSEQVSILSSLGGFFGGIFAARPLNRWYKEKRVATFEITKVI